MDAATTIVDHDATPAQSPEAERHGFVVGNLLGLAVGRASVDAGILVAPHIMPIASLHLQATPNLSGGSKGREALTGFGGELGVRFYTDKHRPAGGFIGTTAGGGRYFASTAALDPKDSTDITSTGIAIELGWTFISDGGTVLTIGAGADMRWAKYTVENGPSSGISTWFVDGVHPRALVQLGRAF